MPFWIGVLIGVIAGAHLGVLMLAFCMAANWNDRTEADGMREALLGRRPASA
jgi:hypothetical protein